MPTFNERSMEFVYPPENSTEHNFVSWSFDFATLTSTAERRLCSKGCPSYFEKESKGQATLFSTCSDHLTPLRKRLEELDQFYEAGTPISPFHLLEVFVIEPPSISDLPGRGNTTINEMIGIAESIALLIDKVESHDRSFEQMISAMERLARLIRTSKEGDRACVYRTLCYALNSTICMARHICETSERLQFRIMELGHCFTHQILTQQINSQLIRMITAMRKRGYGVTREVVAPEPKSKPDALADWRMGTEKADLGEHTQYLQEMTRWSKYQISRIKKLTRPRVTEGYIANLTGYAEKAINILKGLNDCFADPWKMLLGHTIQLMREMQKEAGRSVTFNQYYIPDSTRLPRCQFERYPVFQDQIGDLGWALMHIVCVRRSPSEGIKDSENDLKDFSL